MRNKIVFLVMTLVLVLPLHGQQGTSNAGTPRPEVLVLGVYHMANPGHDVFNMTADDVLSPQRQKEIKEVAAVLATFRPTKIALESDSQKKLDERYAKYLAGEYPLTSNETDQLGLRVARMLGHTAIFAVDADGDFPFQRVLNYAKANGRSSSLEEITAGGWGAMVKSQGEYLQHHTILQTLLFINSDARTAEDVGYYYRLAHYGDPGDYAGADLLADWYRRNIRIFNNVTKLATSPADRILLIFGSGHLGWLRQDFGADPSLRLRKLEEFAQPQPVAGAGH
jgi:hypothetical protein